MSVSGINPQTYQVPVQSSGGGENEDLKAERKAAVRESLKESIEALSLIHI